MQRYDLQLCDGESGLCRAELVPSKSGEYVDFEEANERIAELVANVARLVEAGNHLKQWAGAVCFPQSALDYWRTAVESTNNHDAKTAENG